MIIPYGHEHSTVRRLPWVSFGLMGLCAAVFLVISLAADTGGTEADRDFTELFQFLSSHPYLEVGPELERELFRYIPEEEFRAFLEASRALGGDPPSHPGQIRHEQAELDRIAARALRSLEEARDSPFRRFGLVPAELKPLALITYQFLHGGLLHLLGNMFFLFLAGPFIEDVWGRPLFAGFYLAAGAVAALMFAARYPTLDEPLIGASGAVAGVMGAFLVRYWRTRIRFLYFFFPFRPGTFSAPAWVMLPLWFGRELVFAQSWDVAAPGTGGGGVAHWAHVWGFAFGIAVAAAVSYWRIEERFIHRAIEAKITVHSNPAVDHPLEARAKGEIERSLQLLSTAVREDPDNVGAAASLARAALARPDLPVELHSELAMIAADGIAPEADADSRPAGDAARLIPQPPHLLQVIAAVPQALDDEVLVIAVDGASRRLGLRRVEAIAVGGVARADKRPMVVVDLLLDPPWSDRSELRVVRLTSTDFDPRIVAPGAQPEEALRAFLSRLIEQSGAAPLPDPDGARGLPFRAYASLEEYERNVLGLSPEGSPADDPSPG
jgi:membrane associated rhomboid family serine protease